MVQRDEGPVFRTYRECEAYRMGWWDAVPMGQDYPEISIIPVARDENGNEGYQCILYR